MKGNCFFDKDLEIGSDRVKQRFTSQHRNLKNKKALKVALWVIIIVYDAFKKAPQKKTTNLVKTRIDVWEQDWREDL